LFRMGAFVFRRTECLISLVRGGRREGGGGRRGTKTLRTNGLNYFSNIPGGRTSLSITLGGKEKGSWGRRKKPFKKKKKELPGVNGRGIEKRQFPT